MTRNLDQLLEEHARYENALKGVIHALQSGDEIQALLTAESAFITGEPEEEDDESSE